MGAGSGEIVTNAVRAFTSASRPFATPWPSFENPHVTARKIGTPVREVKLDANLRIDVAGNRRRREGRRPRVLL